MNNEGLKKAAKNSQRIEIVESGFESWMHSIIRKSKAKPSIHIYFMEINLKNEITGLEIAKAIRKVDAQSYIIFVTSCIEVMDQVLQYNIKPMSFILKSDPLLEIRIDAVLERIEYEKTLPIPLE